MSNLLSGLLGGVIGSALTVIATIVFRILDGRHQADEDRRIMVVETCSALNALSIALKSYDMGAVAKALAESLTGMDAIRARYGRRYPTLSADLKSGRNELSEKIGDGLPNNSPGAGWISPDHAEIRVHTRRLHQWNADPKGWERETAKSRAVEMAGSKVNDFDEFV